MFDFKIDDHSFHQFLWGIQKMEDLQDHTLEYIDELAIKSYLKTLEGEYDEYILGFVGLDTDTTEEMSHSRSYIHSLIDKLDEEDIRYMIYYICSDWDMIDMLMCIEEDDRYDLIIRQLDWSSSISSKVVLNTNYYLN